MSKRLLINVRGDDSDLTLAAFPFMLDQFIAGETYSGADEIDTVTVEIDLADRDDTTAAQEQYLNTNEAVIGYTIEDGE